MASGAVVPSARDRGAAGLGADGHIHLRSRHPTGAHTDRGAMVTLSGMELLVVLLIIVLSFSGWQTLRYFTGRHRSRSPVADRAPSSR